MKIATRTRPHSDQRKATVLLTGFEPFGGAKENPSAEIALRLHGWEFGRHRVIGAVLPCVFGESTRALKRLLKTHQPRW